MTILEVERLSKAFPGGIRAVDDVSFALREGEFVTLLGPSGCGKTTMLRLIAGFEFPDAGRILLGGQDVTDDPPHRRQVNTVFQDYALFPHMTVGENVGYGLRVAGTGRDEIARRVREALATVDLTDKIGSRPSQLSGGQRQRVALARAIIRRPKVLLLDEPLSALDVKLREAMQDELRHLHQKLGITFILVTHDQKEALALSDRIMVVERGRIVQAGTPVELYDRPSSPYVANFIGAANLLRARIVGEEDGFTLLAIGDDRIRAARQPAHRAGGEIALAIRPEKAAFDAARANLRGTVVEKTFQGNALRVKLLLGSGEPFIVDLPLQANVAALQAPEAGETIGLHVDPASVLTFSSGNGA
ncbi:MAG: ABC transporter ATP-binding protein [Parvibaculaceae bacterium]